jgi:hypothetical protein
MTRFWMREWLEGVSGKARRSVYRRAEYRKDSEMLERSVRFPGATKYWETGDKGGETKEDEPEVVDEESDAHEFEGERSPEVGVSSLHDSSLCRIEYHSFQKAARKI